MHTARPRALVSGDAPEPAARDAIPFPVWSLVVRGLGRACIRPEAENWSVRNLPKREELLFHTVRALPKFSMIGLVCSTRLCRSPPAEAETAARYCKRILAVAVLPAPDSPEMMTDWLIEFCIIPRCADAATAYTCGGSSACGCRESLYCSSTDELYRGSWRYGLTARSRRPERV